MAIGEALMQYRIKITKETINNLLNEASTLGLSDKFGYDNQKDYIVGELNVNYSILLNLYILRAFGIITKQP